MDKYETNIKYNMGETCVDSLSMNDILDSLPPVKKEEAQRALLDTKLTYGHIRGSPQLKEAIAKLYGPEITPDNVVITNGAIGGNFLAFYTLVNPGEHILVVDPTYQQLSSVPAMFGGKVEPFEIKLEDGYLPDLEKLKITIAAQKTALLVINNPNNPTGFVWENDTLQSIVDTCRSHNVTIMCDEVYRPLFHMENANVKSILSFGYDNTLSTGSMSKSFSLAGLRLGWIVTKNKQFLDGFYEKRDYSTISVSILDDAMATLALQNVETILARNHKICQANLGHIRNFIKDSNGLAEWKEARGGSTCFVRVNAKVPTMQLAENLAENYSTLVVPGEVFKKPGWLRIGFGNSEENVREGLKVLLRWLQEH